MSTGVGRVYLVGAGPGEAGLLTVRGAECLREADLVLYDGLANPLLLSWTRGETLRSCRAGTSRDGAGAVSTHPGWIPQSEINTRLVEAARQGLTVVRLKGGDPFIFGRGSEEAAALEAAGISYEVVPGITAATAAAVYAGLSLTHRECASAVAFVTGHEDPQREAQRLDYAALAAFPGTLVFYMGLHRLGSITEALVAAGKSPQTPVLIVSRATTPQQKVVEGTLNEIAATAREADLVAPSLAIVGEAVRWRQPPAWVDQRPLRGLRIAIPRPRVQGEMTALDCERLGGAPVLLPTVATPPVEDWSAVDALLRGLAQFDWLIFTSVNGVSSFLGRLWELGFDSRMLRSAKIACIGPSTAAELARWHLRADFVPAKFRGEVLADELATHCPPGRALWLRASRGRDVIPERLQAAGWSIETAVVYQNEDVAGWTKPGWELVRTRQLDWVALSSPSMARNWKRLLEEHAGGESAVVAELCQALKYATISPVTTEAARSAGLNVAAEASSYTWEGLFQAMATAEGRAWPRFTSVSPNRFFGGSSSGPDGEA